MAAAVGVHYDIGGTTRSHFTGIERCGSVWACPVCASVIRAKRTLEVEQGVINWQKTDGGLVFVTMTLRHTRDMPLATSIDHLLTGWKKMQMGKYWKKFKDTYEVYGIIRSVEITWSENNGWHPHIHALFFTNETISDEYAEQWQTFLYERWSRIVVGLGAKMPSSERGVDVRVADAKGELLARYLAKVQDGPPKKYNVSKELVRSDVKQGRESDPKSGRKRSLNPFEFLDAEIDGYELSTGQKDALWVEYYEATLGRRSLTWTRGLRDLLGVGKEKTDEELLEDDAEVSRLVALIESGHYRRNVMNQPLLLAAIQECVEGEAWDMAAELSGGSILYDPDTGEVGVLSASISSA